MLKLRIPPGLYKNGTRYQSSGRFYEADLWRWFENAQRPVGGWRQKGTGSVEGRARAIATWRDNANQVWIGVGTHTGLFVMDRPGAVSNITPAGLSPGSESASTGGGYGRGAYGKGFYGAPTPDSTNVIPASAWTLDTYGENLIGAFGTVIYEWAPVPASPAVVLTGAPSAEGVFVTEDRSVMAVGTDGDPRAVAWCDPEDNQDWTPSSTNQAGGKRLQTSGKLMMGQRIRGASLIFSDTDVHRATYVGLPFVYEFQRLASGCGPISKGAVAVVDSRAFWMGINSFWAYDGGVTPLPSDVGDFLFRNLNTLQASKITVMHNSAFGEIGWQYPSGSATECDRVVIFNYREGHWNDYPMDRLCGVDRGVLPYPLMVSPDGRVFEHEAGQSRDGREPYALCGPIELGNGERTVEVHEIIPDEISLGDVEVSFDVGDRPMDPTERVGPFPLAPKIDCRFSGRRVSPSFTAKPDQDFRVGDFRFDVKQGSGR